MIYFVLLPRAVDWHVRGVGFPPHEDGIWVRIWYWFTLELLDVKLFVQNCRTAALPVLPVASLTRACLRADRLLNQCWCSARRNSYVHAGKSGKRNKSKRNRKSDICKCDHWELALDQIGPWLRSSNRQSRARLPRPGSSFETGPFPSQIAGSIKSLACNLKKHVKRPWKLQIFQDR